MSQQKALQHMIAWSIHSLYNTYKEANEILEDTSLSDAEKALKLKGANGTDHRMLNLVCLLQPVLAQAEKEYPEQANFFEWFKERWEYIQKIDVIKGTCGCKGCKDPVVDTVSTDESHENITLQ